MLSHGLWSMIYASEMPSVLQTRHWGKWEGSTKHRTTDVAQARGCDTVGTGKGDRICKTQFYMLLSAFNFKRFSITRREGFIYLFCVFLFLSLVTGVLN